jgi:hypothetical protein
MLHRNLVVTGVLIASLGLFSTAQAQVPKVLGVRGGVSVASASIDDVSGTFDQSNRTGFAGTLFFNTGKGVFSLQPELSYIQKGVEESGTSNSTELSYLELALLLKAGLPLGIARAGVFGGIGADFEMDCKIAEGSQSESCSDAGLETNSPDWNGLFGIDVAVYLGSISLWGDGRYAVGLSNISDLESISYKNRSWIFSAGIGFEL